MSVVTVTAGWYAYYTVDHDTPSHLAMTEHRNLVMVTFGLMVLLAIWSFVASRKDQQSTVLFVGAFLVVGGLLTAMAWHGAELVYRHAVGSMSLQKVEKHESGAYDHSETSTTSRDVENVEDDSGGHHTNHDDQPSD